MAGQKKSRKANESQALISRRKLLGVLGAAFASTGAGIAAADVAGAAEPSPPTSVPTTTGNSQWMHQMDRGRPHHEGLTIKGSGAGTNRPLLMVRDYENAPIAWVAPHGGLSVTDDIRVKTGVFNDNRVSMRRWTDTTTQTGVGGFSWDGSQLVSKKVGRSGSAERLPQRPELWLRVMDNSGHKPRHLVIPAFLEE